jgi:protein-tyrosine phosphatase
MKRSVLFVCTGNICRSPTAEGVLRKIAREQGVELRVESRGTHDYHVGQPPDDRSQQHAIKRGYDLSAQRAKQVSERDFEEFDLIVAMDRGHLAILRRQCPPELLGKVRLFENEVPDPYYGGPDGFEKVLDLLEAGCRNLLAEIRGRSPN